MSIFILTFLTFNWTLYTSNLSFLTLSSHFWHICGMCAHCKDRMPVSQFSLELDHITWISEHGYVLTVKISRISQILSAIVLVYIFCLKGLYGSHFQLAGFIWPRHNFPCSVVRGKFLCFGCFYYSVCNMSTIHVFGAWNECQVYI